MVFFALSILLFLLLFLLSRRLTTHVSSALFALTKSQSTTIHILSFLFLPGIIIHELAHLLVAGVLFVPVGEIEFMPKMGEGGVKLGSVAIGKTDPIRRAIIGLAPILVGLFLLGILPLMFLFHSSIVQTIEPSAIGKFLLLLYAIFAVGNTMFSSAKDMEGFVELSAVFGFFGVVWYIFTILTGMRLALPAISLIRFEPFLQALSFSLSLAVVLDVVVIGVLKLVRK